MNTSCLLRDITVRRRKIRKHIFYSDTICLYDMLPDLASLKKRVYNFKSTSSPKKQNRHGY